MVPNLRRFVIGKIFFLIALSWLSGCAAPAPAPEGSTAAVEEVSTSGEIAIPAAAASATPSPLPATPLSDPTAAPPATALPTRPPAAIVTPTPHPLRPFTLAGLREGSGAAEAPDLAFRQPVEGGAGYRRYYIGYPSGGLIVTGMMNIPDGDGPFPVVVLNHGYYPRDLYWSGAGTWQAADYFAGRGFLTLEPDYRSWGGSDSGLSLFHAGLVRDVLHLLDVIPGLPEADPAAIGMWGHSMGGGITTKVLVVDERVRAAVLYAPNSGEDADLIGRWGAGCLPGEEPAAERSCNDAEVIPADTPLEVVEAYRAAAADPVFLAEVSPIFHLERVTAPVQIHIGLEDGQTFSGTPPEWSEKLARALEEAGGEVTLFAYPGQGHFFQGESWVEFMTRAAAFFEEELRE